jgi:hypothetical protein
MGRARALEVMLSADDYDAELADRVNAIALAPVDDFRRDSDLFAEMVVTPEAQGRIGAALKHGFQTRDAEIDLAQLLGDLSDLPDH